LTLLYLVRHGETEWSRSERHTSVTDLDLTDHGVEQARSLGSRLDVPVMCGQSFPLDVASVSVLGREKQSPVVLRWNS
jgi:broad specificity phosphatase PhoE